MSKKITMTGHSHKSVAEVFDDFVISQTAQGVVFCFVDNKDIGLEQIKCSAGEHCARQFNGAQL